jgi:hypothetical protein
MAPRKKQKLRYHKSTLQLRAESAKVEKPSVVKQQPKIASKPLDYSSKLFPNRLPNMRSISQHLVQRFDNMLEVDNILVSR